MLTVILVNIDFYMGENYYTSGHYGYGYSFLSEAASFDCDASYNGGDVRRVSVVMAPQKHNGKLENIIQSYKQQQLRICRQPSIFHQVAFLWLKVMLLINLQIRVTPSIR